MSNTLTIELPLNVSPEEATLMMSVKLFETGRLSPGQAAKLAGYSKRTYIELLRI
jgi:predicted HTH domain antitoxin